MHVMAASTQGQAPVFWHDMQQLSAHVCCRPSPVQLVSMQYSEGMHPTSA
jgi:hypothetical protein